MHEALARAILRLLGITTILVGTSLTAATLFGWAAFPDGVQSSLGESVVVEGTVGKLARAAAGAYALTIALGFLLCALSPALARYVAGARVHDAKA